MSSAMSSGVCESSAAAPLHFGAAYLRDLAMRCLQALESHETSGVWLDHFRGMQCWSKAWRWGSACSGTDSPSWIQTSIAEAAQLFCGEARMSAHVFSAEIVAWKRDWIKSLCPPQRLVADILDLSAEKAHDCIMDEQFVLKSELAEMDSFIAGFSCKSVSALNVDKQTAQHALMDPATTTGETFRGVLRFLQSHRPKSCILENVRGLERGGQVEEVLKVLARTGYCCVPLLVTPREYGHPQERQRQASRTETVMRS